MRAPLCCCRTTAVPSPSLLRASPIPSPFLRNPNPPLASSLFISTAETEVSEETAAKSLLRRRLILLRHAESKIGGRLLRDHDRPLIESGRTDAISVSLNLQQMGWIPELILSSDAIRTRETLKIMQEHAQGFSEAEVYFVPSFYSIAAMDGQTAEHIKNAVCQYSTNEIFTVMCMGHNRGWEEAASMFSGASIELKTCNAALLEATGKSWDEPNQRKTFGADTTLGACISDNNVRQQSISLYGWATSSQAFALAGLGGWKLHGIVKPDPLS